ncbi:MAG: DmsC/YnfH family molybdoenzyme membrane anchor subunit [Thermodesulfobacteriota bacterium]
MNAMELTLVVFTVLGQTAVGLVLMSAVRQWAAVEGPAGRVRQEWLAALVLLAVGMFVSFFHLGHPFNAYRALVHQGTSWLSREALSYTVFGILILIAFVTMVKKTASLALLKITALVGLIALFVSSLVYAPPSLPALSGGAPTFFFLLTAFIVGAAASSYFAGAEKQGLVLKVLTVSLVVGLVVNLAFPGLWTSGGTVMRQTGLAYFSSGWYWLRILGGLAFPLAVIWIAKRIPVWLPVWLLAGEALGRILFFTHVFHTAVNIGGIY